MKRANNRFDAVLLVVLYLFAAPLYAQTLDQSWNLAYTKGLIHLQREEYKAAERLFQSIIETDDKNARGYHGLGLVRARQNPKSDRARRYFEKAISLDGAFADAYFDLAQVLRAQREYLHQIRFLLRRAVLIDPDLREAWDFWIELEGERGGFGRLFETFADALKKTPANKTVYGRFLYAALYYFEEKKAARVLHDLVELFPENRIFSSDYIRMLTFSRQYDRTIEHLLSMRQDTILSPTFLFQWGAFNHFGDKDTLNAVKSYLSAIDSIKDGHDADLIYEDVRYMCTAEEKRLLEAAPVDSLPYYYRIFWRSRDPNPATPDNERLIDHIGRLNYIRRFCRRFEKLNLALYDPRFFAAFQDLRPLNQGLGIVHSKETIVSFYNALYEKILLGDVLSERARFEIDPSEKRSVDDMGVTILRFGNPDVELWTEADDYIPECSTFYYKRNAAHPELILHFVYLPRAGWSFTSFPININGRGQLGSSYRSLENELTDFARLEKKINEMNTGSKGYALSIWDKISPLCLQTIETVHYILNNETATSEKNQIQLDIAPVSFKWLDKKGELSLLYQLDAGALLFQKRDTVKVAQITIVFRFLKPDYTVVDEFERHRDIILPLTSQKNKSKDYAGIIPFYLLTGRYILEVEVHDANSKKFGLARISVTMPDYFSGLSASDILLTAVKADADEKIFQRGHFDYIPRHLVAYGSSETIAAYLEIYNLTKDSSDRCRYKVDVSLSHAMNKDLDVTILSVHGEDFAEFVNENHVTLDRPFTNDILVIHLRRHDLLRGAFELSLDICDLVTGERLKRKAAFEVY